MKKEQILKSIADYELIVEDLEVYVEQIQGNALVEFYVKVVSPEDIYDQYPQLQEFATSEIIWDELSYLINKDLQNGKTVTGLAQI